MKARISQRAEEDLSHIYALIAARNPAAAERFKTESGKALAPLAEYPQLGPYPGWETRHARLRFWVVSHFHNYLIFSETLDDEVSIERVLGSRRDVRRIVEQAGLEWRQLCLFHSSILFAVKDCSFHGYQTTLSL